MELPLPQISPDLILNLLNIIYRSSISLSEFLKLSVNGKYQNLRKKQNYWQLMFILLLLEIAAAAELYKAGLNLMYSLGNNLLMNPSFDQPIVSAGDRTYQVLTIPQWNCADQCEIQNTLAVCNLFGKNCDIQWNQSIDMDPSQQFTNLSQIINTEEGSLYLVHVEWIAPFLDPIGKSLGISINGNRIYNFTVTSEVYSAQIQQFTIQATAGNLTISLQMFGTTPDSLGIIVSNLRFQKLIPILKQQTIDESLSEFIRLIFTNDLALLINQVPGNRIIAYTFTNFLSIFDRLKLYYFHRQSLSQNAHLFLSSILSFQLQQGSIIQNLIQEYENDSTICSSIDKQYQSLLDALDNQYNYTHPGFLTKNPNGIGFFANNFDFFFYQLPFILVIYLILSMAFKALFNRRVSLYLRKYSFSGIIILMIYEGNMENFSFYFFEEMKNLFSRNITHKVGKIFMLYFFFIAVVFTFGGLLYLKFHYRRLVKYFTEEYRKTTPYVLMIEAFEKSIFPLLFGAIHSLLIDNLALQTVILGIVEVAYFAVKMLNLRSIGVKLKFKVVLSSVTSLLRMGFIVSFYLFENIGGHALINTIHHDMIWLYLICWVVQLVYDVLNLAAGAIAQIIRHSRSKDNHLKQESSKIKRHKQVIRQDLHFDKATKFQTTANKGQERGSNNRSYIKVVPIIGHTNSKDFHSKSPPNKNYIKEPIDQVLEFKIRPQKRSASKKPKDNRKQKQKREKSPASKRLRMK